MSFSYANPGSGPGAGGIGWFNYGDLTMSPGDSLTGLTGTLNDGTTVTFDLSLVNTSGVPHTFVSNNVPVFGSMPFGSVGYTGIGGKTALYSNVNVIGAGVNTFTISNIVVKDNIGNPISNYTVVLADAESTNLDESLVWKTNGSDWKLLATLGGNPPILAGIGTQTVTISGTTLFPQISAADYVATTQGPSQVTIQVTESPTGRQAFSFGFAVSKINIEKNIGKRIFATDQFALTIGGTPTDTKTTTGTSVGIQNEVATVYTTPGNTYSINEAMAPGSTSILSDYNIKTTAVNITPGGTIPTSGLLPLSFTPLVGDEVTYTILNAATPDFRKTVDKEYADQGDILNYTVIVNNPNNYPINNILVTDVTPAGTTYIGNLLVSEPYTGTNLTTGITIGTLGPNATATVKWQVQVDSNSLTNQIINIASVNIPGETSGNTNIVTTKISHADLTTIGNFNKTVDKSFAETNEILTYKLMLKNTGNTAANSVVIADAIPSGTTYVPGSITADVPFIGDPLSLITLTGPILAGATATITFKVKVNAAVPIVNPIPNSASVNYKYTVDPANPNGVNSVGNSNTVTTKIVDAIITTKKTVDKNISYVGDIITYNITVNNSGNTDANNVQVKDILSNSITYIPGTLIVSAPSTGTPITGIDLTNPVKPGETISISFKVKVLKMPNPNPITNQATTEFTYTVDPVNPNGKSGLSVSNEVYTRIFKNNYQQQINDVINSVANEEAALASIANSEGSKIQKIISMQNTSAEELLCINESVKDMLDSINLLNSILREKINSMNCQISGGSC